MARRVLFLVDVSNIYYCLKKKFSGGKLDYRKLLEAAQRHGQVYASYAYASQIDEQAEKFFTCLQQFGYRVKTKTPKEYTAPITSPNSVSRKANWDIGIVIDMMRHMNKVDTIVLASADGDFAEAVKFVIEHSIDVHILACNISKDLKDAATSWTEIGPNLLEPDSVTKEGAEIAPTKITK